MSSVKVNTARKPLAEMDPEELRQWLLKRRQQLAHHKRFTRRYLHRQAQRQRNKQTYTDWQYARFQTLADDLLELLDGVIANIDQQKIQPEHRQRWVDEG